MNLPHCSHDQPYTDTCVHIETAADLRKLLEGVPDETPVYFFGYGVDTVYPLEAGWKTQECIEHSGYRHEKTGLIFQIEG